MVYLLMMIRSRVNKMRGNNVGVEYALELIEHNIQRKDLKCAVCIATFDELKKVWAAETKKRYS
jgi:hypothetical protein